MPLALIDLQTEISSLHGKVRQLEDENYNLRLQVQALQLAQARPAKPDDANQCHLDIVPTESMRVEQAEADGAGDGPDAQPEPRIPSSTTKRKGKKRIVGPEKFEHLEITRQTVLIPEEVKANPDAWEEIGEEATDEVIVHPTRLSRHRIVRKKFREKANRDASPIIAKAPVRFSCSHISISLAVYIVLCKYLEHGALHRLERKFARMGADITRQSQSDTVDRFARWMRPLYELIERRAKAGGYLQIDETFIKYINGKSPGSGQGYFWAIHAPGQSMVLRWVDNRRHENAALLLGEFSGILQSDGYAAYTNYASIRPGVDLAGCWSHVFRKFRDAAKHEPGHAAALMRLIQDLYQLEEKWDAEGVTDSRRKILRGQLSMPIADAIKERLDAHAADMAIPNNAFREAVSYAANRWDALKECLRHGHTRLDTNLLESKFRPTKIGEKNWMFIGHPAAGQKSAVAYTLLACCRIHSIEPRAYLEDVLEKLVPHDGNPPADLLEALLPENWAKANPEHTIKEPASN